MGFLLLAAGPFPCGVAAVATIFFQRILPCTPPSTAPVLIACHQQYSTTTFASVSLFFSFHVILILQYLTFILSTTFMLSRISSLLAWCFLACPHVHLHIFISATSSFLHSRVVNGWLHYHVVYLVVHIFHNPDVFIWDFLPCTSTVLLLALYCMPSQGQ